MDFMRLLKSVEELLYELVTWVLFYPLTLWRCLRNPVKMMAYAETELGDNDIAQYDDALSPPIFLLITLFIAHLIELRFGTPTKGVLPAVFSDERNLLLFRAVAFSIFPLLLALVGVRQRRTKLTRRSLKPAFYSQCYTAAPFILSADLAVFLAEHGTMPTTLVGVAVFALGLIWYLGVQTTWFTSRGAISRARSFWIALGTIILGFVAVIVVTALTTLAVSNGS